MVNEQGGQEMERMKCYECCDTTSEHCSYCLLPVCEQHGRRVTPWYTSRQVLVCTPCQARLREIAQEEECLSVAAHTRQRASVVHVVPSDCDSIVSAERFLSLYT